MFHDDLKYEVRDIAVDTTEPVEALLEKSNLETAPEEINSRLIPLRQRSRYSTELILFYAHVPIKYDILNETLDNKDLVPAGIFEILALAKQYPCRFTHGAALAPKEIWLDKNGNFCMPAIWYERNRQDLVFFEPEGLLPAQFRYCAVPKIAVQ